MQTLHTLTAESVAGVDSTLDYLDTQPAVHTLDPVSRLSRLEARRAYGYAKHDSMYGREWETCEGTEGMSADELAELAAEWRRADKRTESPTEYRIIAGREFTEAEYALWTAHEETVGHIINAAEFLTVLGA